MSWKMAATGIVEKFIIPSVVGTFTVDVDSVACIQSTRVMLHGSIYLLYR